MLYPIHLDIKGMPCVVIGGGPVGSRKVAGLVACKAEVTVIAPIVDERIDHLEAEGKVTILRKPYHEGDLTELMPKLVFLAAVRPVNKMALVEAKRIGAFVNDATEDVAEDFIVPTRVRRGNFLLSISTGGASPAFSKFLRRELEKQFPPWLDEWMEKLDALRAEAQKRIPAEHQAAFWDRVFSRRLLEMVQAGEITKAEEEVRHAISDSGAQS